MYASTSAVHELAAALVFRDASPPLVSPTRPNIFAPSSSGDSSAGSSASPSSSGSQGGSDSGSEGSSPSFIDALLSSEDLRTVLGLAVGFVVLILLCVGAIVAYRVYCLPWWELYAHVSATQLRGVRKGRRGQLKQVKARRVHRRGRRGRKAKVHAAAEVGQQVANDDVVVTTVTTGGDVDNKGSTPAVVFGASDFGATDDIAARESSSVRRLRTAADVDGGTLDGMAPAILFPSSPALPLLTDATPQGGLSGHFYSPYQRRGPSTIAESVMWSAPGTPMASAKKLQRDNRDKAPTPSTDGKRGDSGTLSSQQWLQVLQRQRERQLAQRSRRGGGTVGRGEAGTPEEEMQRRAREDAHGASRAQDEEAEDYGDGDSESADKDGGPQNSVLDDMPSVYDSHESSSTLLTAFSSDVDHSTTGSTSWDTTDTEEEDEEAHVSDDASHAVAISHRANAARQREEAQQQRRQKEGLHGRGHGRAHRQRWHNVDMSFADDDAADFDGDSWQNLSAASFPLLPEASCEMEAVVSVAPQAEGARRYRVGLNRHPGKAFRKSKAGGRRWLSRRFVNLWQSTFRQLVGSTRHSSYNMSAIHAILTVPISLALEDPMVNAELEANPFRYARALLRRDLLHDLLPTLFEAENAKTAEVVVVADNAVDAPDWDVEVVEGYTDLGKTKEGRRHTRGAGGGGGLANRVPRPPAIVTGDRHASAGVVADAYQPSLPTSLGPQRGVSPDSGSALGSAAAALSTSGSGAKLASATSATRTNAPFSSVDRPRPVATPPSSPGLRQRYDGQDTNTQAGSPFHLVGTTWEDSLRWDSRRSSGTGGGGGGRGAGSLGGRPPLADPTARRILSPHTTQSPDGGVGTPKPSFAPMPQFTPDTHHRALAEPARDACEANTHGHTSSATTEGVRGGRQGVRARTGSPSPFQRAASATPVQASRVSSAHRRSDSVVSLDAISVTSRESRTSRLRHLLHDNSAADANLGATSPGRPTRARPMTTAQAVWAALARENGAHTQPSLSIPDGGLPGASAASLPLPVAAHHPRNGWRAAASRRPAGDVNGEMSSASYTRRLRRGQLPRPDKAGEEGSWSKVVRRTRSATGTMERPRVAESVGTAASATRRGSHSATSRLMLYDAGDGTEGEGSPQIFVSGEAASFQHMADSSAALAVSNFPAAEGARVSSVVSASRPPYPGAPSVEASPEEKQGEPFLPASIAPDAPPPPPPPFPSTAAPAAAAAGEPRSLDFSEAHEDDG